jgi:antitoxin HicB
MKTKRIKAMETKMTARVSDYLKLPYGRCVVPDSDGSFRSEIVEFPGCFAVGDTAAEALANLENVAASWLAAAIAKGQRIPEPIENGPFSGKLVVRLPKTLHKKAAHAAARDRVSLNQFIVSSIAEQVGMGSGHSLFQPVRRWQQITNVSVFLSNWVAAPSHHESTLSGSVPSWVKPKVPQMISFQTTPEWQDARS